MIFLDSIKSLNKKEVLAVGFENNDDKFVFEIEYSRNHEIGINLSYIMPMLDIVNGKITIDTKPARMRIRLKK